MGGLTKADYAASGATATAVYFPFDQDNTPTYSGGWTFTNTYYAYYLTAEKVAYTFSGNIMNLTLNMSVPEGFVQFFLADPSAVSGTFALTESHITPQALTGVGTDGTVTTDTKTAGYALTGYVYETGAEKGYLFSGILAAGARNASTSYSISLVEQEPTVGYAINTSVLNKTTTLYTSATTKRALKLPAVNATNWSTCQIPFVDLGTGDILWATGNLKADGIAGPEEIGLFYPWGGITGYDKDSGHQFSEYGYVTPKYTGTDYANLTEGGDDAAYAVNNNWRMPTKDEFAQLIALPSVFDVHKYYYTGTNGLTLYLKDCGYMNNNGAYSSPNSNANWWSSSYKSEEKCTALYIKMNGINVTTASIISYDRNKYGFQIRPVLPK
jgi:hypothetical protein